jgi:hypothetical protein
VFEWVTPMPPPTVTLKPISFSFLSSMMAMKPRSFVKMSTSLLKRKSGQEGQRQTTTRRERGRATHWGGTAIDILNLRGR